MKNWMIGCLAAALILVVGYAAEESDRSLDEQIDSITAPEDEVVKPTRKVQHYMLMRYAVADNLEKLKESASYLFVADYVKNKRVYEKSGLFFTESIFHVGQVLKGDKGLKGAEIVITETGAQIDDKLYVFEGDELFNRGKYLLFLDRSDADDEFPYDQYYVKGVITGKFKLSNGKVKGYGDDDVRKEAEKLKPSALIKAVK